MSVDEIDGKFLISRGGSVGAISYFSFFVDHDSSSWTKYISLARKHDTEDEAYDTLMEIRSRCKLQSEERVKRQLAGMRGA